MTKRDVCGFLTKIFVNEKQINFIKTKSKIYNFPIFLFYFFTQKIQNALKITDLSKEKNICRKNSVKKSVRISAFSAKIRENIISAQFCF